MHFVARLVCAAIVSLATTQVARAQSVFSAKAVSFEAAHSVEYHGEGWRNLRKVEVATDVGGMRLDLPVYLVCGTNKFITPNSIDQPKDFESHPSKSEHDQLLKLGGIDEISGASMGFELSPADERRLRSALKGVCDSPVDIADTPSNILLSISSARFAELIPQRFTRDGQRVSTWFKEQEYRDETGKAGFISIVRSVLFSPTKDTKSPKWRLTAARFSTTSRP